MPEQQRLQITEALTALSRGAPEAMDRLMPLVDPTDDLREQLQKTLGASYTLERELGGGGMSRVFGAEETTLGRRVVLKVLPPEMSGLVSVERFRREVQLAARLQHPHIVPLLSAGESGGLLYYTMPLVEGETLRARLSRDGALPLPVAMRVFRGVTKALAYAHRHAVVHRDIKPENVLLGEDDEALVADFGIAKALAAAITTPEQRAADALTSVGVAVGTPAYMAPEQAMADPQADHRADLYALGVVAYEMIAGSHPFAGRTLQAIVAAHATEVPESLGRRRPSVPAELAALVMRLLEKQAADRPQSAGDVLQALDAVASPVSSADLRTNPSGPTRRFRHRTATLATIAGYVVVAGLGVNAVWRARGIVTGGVAHSGAAVATPAVKAHPSVAVLPFANTSGNSADEPFSDGLTDDLIGALGKVSGLRVAGRTSAFALKGKGLGVRAVAETLGVAHVLEGSVRRAGNRFRVTATLVSAADGGVLWTNTYDRVLIDVFAVQEEIARAIVDSLRVKLAVAGENPRLVKVPTTNLAAYDLYLKGQYFLNGRSSRVDLLQALSYFEQATTRDPTYARAYAAMSSAHAYLAIFAFGNPHQEFARAKAAALKALELDSALAEAHAALAHMLFAYEWNWEAAEREFRLAITLDPANPTTRYRFAVCLQGQGRFDEALSELRQALATDPLDGGSRSVMGRVLINARQPERAIPYLLDAIKFGQRIDLSCQQLGHAYLMMGKHPEAIGALRRAAELSGVRDSAHLAYGYAVANQRGSAERIVRDLIDSGKRRDLPPFHIAMAYAGLGEVDEAFRWLERGFEQRGSFMDGVKVTPAFEPLHADPRWARLLQRMGLKS